MGDHPGDVAEDVEHVAVEVDHRRRLLAASTAGHERGEVVHEVDEVRRVQAEGPRGGVMAHAGLHHEARKHHGRADEREQATADEAVVPSGEQGVREGEGGADEHRPYRQPRLEADARDPADGGKQDAQRRRREGRLNGLSAQSDAEGIEGEQKGRKAREGVFQPDWGPGEPCQRRDRAQTRRVKQRDATDERQPYRVRIKRDVGRDFQRLRDVVGDVHFRRQALGGRFGGSTA